MHRDKYRFNPFTLTFQDEVIEHRFQHHCQPKQRDRIQVGFGFLVLFFMAVAASQLIFFNAPLLANLCYAALGLVALVGFSMFNPRFAADWPDWVRWLLVTLVAVGVVMTTYLPSISIALQMTAASVTLIWLSLFAGLYFRQFGLFLLVAVAPVLLGLSLLSWPLSAARLAGLTSLGLIMLFASLAAYMIERAARADYQQLQRAANPRHGSGAIKQDHALQLLKELTIELSGLSDSDASYNKMLSMIKRAIPYDLAAVGRLQNERIMPVLVRSGNNEAGSEDTIKLLWHANLIAQLQKHKAPLIGPAEMGLLATTVEKGEITFGYRLDIPFFSQRRLDGIITILRSTPVFSDSESALAASMVFHGLFARRSARLQQQADQASSSRGDAAATVEVRPRQKTILSVDAFLEQANNAFQRAQSAGKPVSLILIEIERHDHYLERFGSKGVARIFESIGNTLSDNIPSGSLLGRYGAGSFAMQLPLALDQATQLAGKLRQAIGRHGLTVGSEKVALTVNTGVSARDASSPDFLSLLRGADIGLYLARGEKGNSARFHH